jgi:tellurite resistance protein TehA-like permease
VEIILSFAFVQAFFAVNPNSLPQSDSSKAMSTRSRDGNIENGNDRIPLLGGRFASGRDRNLPTWRHILENKMTWAWYNTIIASGSISLLLYDLPYRIHKLWVLGAIIYIISLILFLVTLLVHAVRFALRPSLVPNSIMHPEEGHFISTLPAALGILILNGVAYADKMHSYNNNAMVTFFWIFIVLTLLFGVGSPLAQFSQASTDSVSPRVFINTDHHTSVAEADGTSRDITPTNLTSLLPFLIAGPVACAVSARLGGKSHYHHTSMAIFTFGVILQGLGILLTMLYQSSIITKLLADGFRPPRAALFLTVIGPALTSLSATSMAEMALAYASPHIDKDHIVLPPGRVAAGLVLNHIGIVIGLVFWGLAAWWFVVSAVASLTKVTEAREASNHFLHMFNVVFAHATLFLATNQLLRVYGWPKVLTVLNEILGVATVVVWAFVVLSVCVGIISGRLMRD